MDYFPPVTLSFPCVVPLEYAQYPTCCATHVSPTPCQHRYTSCLLIKNFKYFHFLVMDLRFLIPAMEVAILVIVFMQVVVGGSEMNMVFYMQDTFSGSNVTTSTTKQ